MTFLTHEPDFRNLIPIAAPALGRRQNVMERHSTKGYGVYNQFAPHLSRY